MKRSDSPLLKLNHAVAIAMVDGPDAGLALIAPLDRNARLRGSHWLDAVRAHLLERAGQNGPAIVFYHLVAEKTASIFEKNSLTMRAAKLKDQVGLERPISSARSIPCTMGVLRSARARRTSARG